MIPVDTAEMVETVSRATSRRRSRRAQQEAQGMDTQVNETTKLLEQARRRNGATTVVDMTAVLDVLAEAMAMAETIDEVQVPVDDRSKSTLMGEVSRTLNRLADMLSVASAEAKVEYWRFKGFTDPRE